MSSPQLEDGYVRIANELLEAILRSGLGKRELLIVFAVIRKTYGFGKKADEISLSQLQSMTGIYPSHLSKSVTALVSGGVLLKQSGSHANSLSLNKRYAEWRVLPKRSGVTETVSYRNGNEGVTETVQNPLPKQSLQKTTQKTTPKDREARRPARRCPDDFVVTEEMRQWARVECPGVDLERETRKFMDHEFAKARSDWPATWRNWIRRAQENMPRGASHARKPSEIHAAATAHAFRPLPDPVLQD